MKKILILVCALFIATTTFAQKTDTVVVELAKTSRMVFTIKDKKDLEQLKQYDFQVMFDDIITRLENNDSVVVVVNQKTESTVVENSESWANRDSSFANDDDDNDDNTKDDHRKKTYRKVTHMIDIDLGLNSYLQDGKFPDETGEPYAIRPWGSWNIGLNSILATRFTRNFYTAWGLGVSWHNFKFQNDNTLVSKDDTGVEFEEDYRDVSFIKSKLGVAYLNASAIPMFVFGGNSDGKRYKSYRIGAGPYVGYRIGSWTKQVYKDEDGDRHRDRTRDNFYLNNLRYGVRLQIGIRSADFFFAYDMNELFAAGKGPKLNAFSFGITL